MQHRRATVGAPMGLDRHVFRCLRCRRIIFRQATLQHGEMIVQVLPLLDWHMGRRSEHLGVITTQKTDASGCRFHLGLL